jgi:hypothetical protein
MYNMVASIQRLQKKKFVAIFSFFSGLRVFGVVSGLLAFLFISAITVYCCCYRRPQPTAQPFFQSRVLSRRHTAC